MTTPTASPALVADVPAVIAETTRLLTAHYVFPEVADRLAALLRARLEKGAYDTADPAELGARVTADLQSENGDQHLRLKFHPEPLLEDGTQADLGALRREFAASLGGVPRVELLQGAAALLELAPKLFPLAWAAEPLSAALTLIARADTLILDLRETVGGDPDAVAFVCSHLLDGRTHLNTQYWRAGDRYEQFWTLPHVPGARFGGVKPVYVLTSGRTFSAGEELAYDLQQLGRAVVVGETTRGGAHPRDGWAVHPHLEASIPVGRAINPVSGTNWEGTGVRPDVPCPADMALDRALHLAAGEPAPRP
ncbi:S41 family peptidase [Streptomyces alanosinicus]|uniref:Interphotoreceptor retinoid-binding protein n=1 Tax=Streptomyces alanosinicus TaxID=68171 RepID=A0A918YL68_9ACTN|nr:S41 family peptidase [Streptomyces alanosinicus]GHE07165.1 interphotoreceptor retinoid-binding protein [Streptomyces alanosinicus]